MLVAGSSCFRPIYCQNQNQNICLVIFNTTSILGGVLWISWWYNSWRWKEESALEKESNSLPFSLTGKVLWRCGQLVGQRQKESNRGGVKMRSCACHLFNFFLFFGGRLITFLIIDHSPSCHRNWQHKDRLFTTNREDELGTVRTFAWLHRVLDMILYVTSDSSHRFGCRMMRWTSGIGTWWSPSTWRGRPTAAAMQNWFIWAALQRYTVDEWW